MVGSQGVQFFGERFRGPPGVVAFDHDRRSLVGTFSDSDKGAASHSGVLVENRLTRDTEEGSRVGLDAVGLAAAKPKSPLCVEVTHVTHAVPGGVTVSDLSLIHISEPTRPY